MSAVNETNSPSGSTPTAGATPTNAAKPPPVYRRKKVQVDPLIRKKPPGKNVSKPVGRAANGVESIPSLQNHTIVRGSKQDASDYQGPFEEFKIVTTKRALRDGLRFHVMRLLPALNNKEEIFDPRNDDQFTPPVRLHRRDPRANPFGPGVLLKEEEEKSDANPIDEKEREKREAIKREKQAAREAHDAQTAPVMKNPVKKENRQKKTEQVFQAGDLSATKGSQKIRYEESLPWHLEDFDNKQTWSGTYEASLSQKHLMLLKEPNTNKFRMVPVEKWYKFRPKDKFQALTVEEAEARLAKKVKDPRWFMERKQEQAAKRKQTILQQRHKAMSARRGERGERMVNDEDWEGPEIAADVDDIDYDYEEAFADDEENPLFAGVDEEDAKEAENRIKREQREANVFDIKEEKDYDAEEEAEKRKADEGKKKAKRLQKALMKRENNYIYEDDSDRNPYSSESDSEDSEVERLKQEEEKKKSEAAQEGATNDADAQNKLKTSTDGKLPSGSSTKGTTTPSSSQPKPATTKSTLKRPGSPNLSEASGNESARKKVKKRHGMADSTTGSRTASRAASPSGGLSSRGGHASGSDGEMSDTSGATRPNYRASKLPSRTTSPSAAHTVMSPLPMATPTADELRAAIPPEGLTLTDFMKRFRKRMRNQEEAVELMKQNAQFVKENRTLYPIGAKLPDEVLEMRRVAREKRLAAQRASGNGTPAGASGGLSPGMGAAGGASDGRKSPAS